MIKPVKNGTSGAWKKHWRFMCSEPRHLREPDFYENILLLLLSTAPAHPYATDAVMYTALIYFCFFIFLVAYMWLYKSLCWSVGWSVRLSVSHAVWKHTKRRFNIHYCPCPPVWDWWCRVYGLVVLQYTLFIPMFDCRMFFRRILILPVSSPDSASASKTFGRL